MKQTANVHAKIQTQSGLMAPTITQDLHGSKVPLVKKRNKRREKHFIGIRFFSQINIEQLFLLQKRRFFRIKNGERGEFMSVQGGVDEMKSGRVVVSAQVEPMSDIWYYQDGLVKNKVMLGRF